jgi:Family of unknown function (DUF5681)
MIDKRREPSLEPEEAIGYGNPPKRTRFQPGQSGNVKGRPRGSKNFGTLFAEELSLPVVLTENGKRRKMPKLQALAKQVINKALSNDHRSAALVFDQIRRSDGTSDAPVALDARRPESRLVMENIIRRIRLADVEAVQAAGAPHNVAEAPSDEEES